MLSGPDTIWLRPPFGLEVCNALDEYQQRQQQVLEGLRGVALVVDDTLLSGSGNTIEKPLADHDKNLLALMQ